MAAEYLGKYGKKANSVQISSWDNNQSAKQILITILLFFFQFLDFKEISMCLRI